MNTFNKKPKKKTKVIKKNNFSLIENRDKNKTIVIKYTEYEINILSYEEAIKIDKRSYITYYMSLLKTKHIFLSIFYNNKYNSPIVKLVLFFFSFGLNYTINSVFYNDDTIHNISIKKGKYDFIYQLPKIIYSNIISIFITSFMNFLSSSEKQIINAKHINIATNSEKILSKLKTILLIKFIFFYVFSGLFMIFFWVYISCFCIAYKNTQLYLIKDTLISFFLSLFYPILYYLVPGIFRIYSLKDEKKSKKCMYNLSKLIQSI